MGKIVAIGGGECGRPGTVYETQAIDTEIISLTCKKSPNFLLIALGNNDPDLYFRTLGKIYKDFGCNVDELKKTDLDRYDVIEKKIQWADIIYVGGGNSLRLMNIFRKYHITELLEEAYRRNKVLCGLSAGAICWCDYGNSNSRKETSNKIIRVRALGFLHVLLCPHYDVDINRKISLKEMMKRTYKIPALALDNCAAIEVLDDEFRIISSNQKAQATKCFWKEGIFVEEKIEKDKFYKLDSLYKK